jgi:alpha-glucosidase
VSIASPAATTDPSRTDRFPAAPPWWRSAVVYQIYPRSFADSDGDGIGDLNGVRSRLPYLKGLGVDAIWLSPFYASPQADAGYDVSDYRAVDPVFGTLEDARCLIGESHTAGLKIIVDLVPNHTSDQHTWFQAALAAAPGSLERARYVFREGRGSGGELPPNNWLSNFGGPAWTRLADGWWYLHLFAPEQPDLDWTNPEVVQEFKAILRFWLDLGVDGFRIDVAHGLAKDPALPDLTTDGQLLSADSNGEHPHWDRDEVHEVYRGWREVIQEYPGDRIFVAEAWVPNPDRFARYLRADELHTAFNFNFLEAGWDARSNRRVIDQTISELRDVGAPATWVLSNHDVVRHVTRFGGGTVGLRRAKAATAMMLALPGGAYLYQGEELGLEEVLDIPGDLRQDPIFERTGGERLGRDGCRVPLPWSGTSAPFGFGPEGTPWLPQPCSWATETVEIENADPDSTLTFYRSMLARRRENPDLGEGDLQWLTTSDSVLAFRRGNTFSCIVNFGPDPIELPVALDGSTVILSSSPTVPGLVPPDTTLWLATRP